MKGELLDKPTVADLLSQESTGGSGQAPKPTPPKDEEPDTDLGGMMPHPA